ncbi:hypothetical protein PG985_013151 [Apiospora marii]|uniref:Major facilitator superfamily (MFS) profile domain-containing protein n=1 Tax=Apiospora marii TaxID=335849 RepID=A0ABR1R8M7_9PEZI
MPFPPAEPAEGVEAKPIISKKNEIVLFSSTAIALYGYDQGMMSMVNTNRSYLRTMQIGETSPVVGIIVSVYYLGCAVGAVVASDWADRKGRKPSIFACLVTAVVGNLLMFVAGLGPRGANPWGGAALACMLAGRVVLGLAVGGIDATIPVYSAELSKDEARGRALAQEFQMNIFGLLLAFAINLVATSALGKDSEWAWRVPIVAMQFFPVALLSLISRLPETPRWYMSKWRKEEAKEALVTLHGEDKAKEMLQELSAAQREEDDNNEKIGYMDMLMPSGSQFHPSMVTVMGQINQALTGYGAVSVYGPQVFELLGFGVREAEYVTLGNFISYFLFMTVAWLWIDRYGRRKLMVWGSVGLSTCFALLSAFGALSLDAPGVSRLAAEIPGAVVMFVATAIFGICWLATVWLIPTEIYPSSARAQGSAISVIVWGLANFAVTLLTPIVFNNLKYWLFLAFAVTNAFAGWWTWRYSPESGGRSFEENQEFFNSALEEDSWVVRQVDEGKFLRMPDNGGAKGDSVEEATPLLRSRR